MGAVLVRCLRSPRMIRDRTFSSEHEAEMGRLSESYTSQIERLGGQIIELEKEVTKYKTLAGIDELTKDALEAAKAASKEAGFNDDTSAPSERVLAVTGTPNIPNGTTDGAPPPPPPPPPPPSAVGGPPPPPPPPPGAGPPPPPGGPGFGARTESGKPVINPKMPMKPLFWKRLQVHTIKTPSRGPSSSSNDKANLFWEQVEEENLNFDQFIDLFSKTPVEPKKKAATSKAKSKTVQPAKVISPKRSQAVGILLSSLRLEFSEIEMAILNLDTSILSTEKFQAIYDARSEPDEMKEIKKQLDKQPDVPLDKPEQFLWDFEQIPHGANRIFCFIFQSTFQEAMTSIDSKLSNLKMTCDILSTHISVKRIFGLILACGNYMNGGSRTRGQADGFDLEILPKLKDVKGKDNRTSLLQFVVTHYLYHYDSELMGTDRAKLPLPDPSDIHQAGLVNFEDIQKELKRLQKDFQSADTKANAIISSSSKDNLEPFKTVMSAFFNKGRQDLKEQAENIEECHKVFTECVQFFCVKPKPGEKEVTPEYFFSLWLTFCTDFKYIWKKEQQVVMKIRIREAEERVRKIKESKTALPPTRARKIGGLKDRLSRHGKLN